MSKGKYSEAEYWSNRANPNSRSGSNSAGLQVIELIEGLTDPNSNILLFGPGTGGC